MIELKKNNIECMSSVSGGCLGLVGAALLVGGIATYVYRNEIKAEWDAFKGFEKNRHPELKG